MTKILFFKKEGIKHLGFLVLMFVFCASMNAQTTVSGTVSDKNGPLPGVTVLVEGTSNGQATDFDGKFTLSNVASNSTLVISSIGFMTQKIAVNGQSTINILMAEDLGALDEIVIVGYGSQSKTTVTGAISTLSADDVKTIPVPNVSQTLAGRVAGVSMRPNGGGPGGDNPDIHIRGIVTTGNNAPLIVVDGVRRDNINQVDPNSIDTVTILKDAAAIAPFGIGGANGVILITTKQGQVGKPVISISSSYAFQNPTYVPNMLNAQDYMSLQNEGYFNNTPTGTTPPWDPAYVTDYNNLHASDPYRYPDSNFLGEFNKDFGVMMNNISVSGGTEAVKYQAGLGHYDQDGLFDPMGYKRYTYNLNLDTQVTSTTKFGISVRGSFERTKNFDGNTDVGGLLRSFYKFVPYRTLRYPEGDKWGESSASSPVALLESEGYARNDRNTLLSSVYIEQELPFIKGLSVKGVFSYDPRQVAIKNWHIPQYYHNIDLTTNPYSYALTPTTQEGRSQPYIWLSQEYNKGANYTYQAYVNYKRSFGDHNVTGLFVAEARENTYEYFNTSRNNFALQIDELSLGSSNRLDYNNGGGSNTGSEIGYVYRVGYTYKDKYILEASGRYDGHYFFAPGKRWGFFPAFSAAWRVSEESFMDNIDAITSLKVRGSWGKSGNLAGGPFQYLSGYDLRGNRYAFGNSNLVQGSSEASEANPNITWEIATKFDIGFDLNLWNNGLRVEFDYFTEDRTGMLLAPNVTLPIEYGLGLSQENKGSMSNKGFELTLSTQKNWDSGLSLFVSANYSYSKNSQIEVFESDAQAANPNRTNVGRQLGTPFGYKSLGLFSTADDTNSDGLINAADGYTVTQFGDLHPGDVRYADLNGDDRINNDDIVPIGNPVYPKSTYGLNTSLRYKGFNLTTFFQGSGGSDINIRTFLTSPFDNNGSNVSYEYFNNRWLPDNQQNAKYPRSTPSPTGNNTQGSDFWMVDTSYLRLKTLVLGYDLPQSVCELLSMKNIGLTITGQNLLTISELDFIDPELGYNGRETAYPVTKSFAFGVNFSF
jgi:TonB-linked SusC/RagA family outer membrane protein